MVITSEWKRGLFAYQHPFRCCAIWKIQLLHKFALFQIEYFTGAQQTWENFKIFYNLPNILVFLFRLFFSNHFTRNNRTKLSKYLASKLKFYYLPHLALTKKMPTCVNFLKNVKCITASLNVCPSPLKALLSGLFCLQLFSGTPLNRTGPPNHFLLNYLFLSSYLTSISFCFLDKCI